MLRNTPSLTPGGMEGDLVSYFSLLFSLVVFCWSHCYWRPGEVHSGTQGNGGLVWVVSETGECVTSVGDW